MVTQEEERSRKMPELSEEELDKIDGHVKHAADTLGIVIGPALYGSPKNYLKMASIDCSGIYPGDSETIVARARKSLSEAGLDESSVRYDEKADRIVIEKEDKQGKEK